MVEVPEKVDVLGLTYTVEVCDLEDDDGTCSPSKQRIEIRSGMSPEKTQQVFLHELVHAILDQLCFSDEYADERLVQGLAVGLHQALCGATPSSS